MVQGNRLLLLKHLSLADTSLDLADVVHFQGQLKSLDVRHNTMSAEGMKVLSQGK